MAELTHSGGRHREGVLTEGDVFYAAALRAIRNAKRRVWLDMYIFQDDVIGHDFAAALADRARAGVQVIVVYDRVGSFESSESFFQGIRAAGASVLPFRPWPWTRKPGGGLRSQRAETLEFVLMRIFRWIRLAFLRRDHRKILIVDRKLAFTGGFNIMRENSLRHFGRARWLDAMYYTEIPAIVRALESIFMDTLRRARRPHLELYALSRKRVREAILFPFWKAPQANRIREGRQRIKRRGKDPLRAKLRVARLRAERMGVARAFKKLLRSAENRICLMFPYFVPYGGLIRLLTDQAKRGVRVRVFLSEQSDLPMINDVAYFIAQRLTAKGVEVWMYHGRETSGAPPRFCHAKVCLIDDWVGVGTANFDRRSLVLNLETLVLRKNPPFIDESDAFFETLRRFSEPYDPARYRIGRIRGQILYLFRWLL